MLPIDTDDGRFVDGDPITGALGTRVSATWLNTMQDELLTLLTAAGIDPAANDSTQVLQSLAVLIANGVGTRPMVYSILQVPTTNVGPAIIVTEAGEIWPWVTTAHFTGYRSPLCGRPLDGHTTAPAAHEIDAVGGTLSKAAYARLWAYARENNLVVTQAVWNSNIGAHYFVDTGADTFRVPDLRNMFRRYSGTDADTANARALGSRQLDAGQLLTGVVGAPFDRDVGGAFRARQGSTQYFAGSQTAALATQVVDFDSSRVARASTETRSVNVAYAPRLHA